MHNPPQILVVDDEELVLDLLKESLSPHFAVTTARSGSEALDCLTAGDFAVLLADQRMPGMTGVALAAAARQLQPHLVSILLSAYSDPKEVIAAINDGQVFRFVPKPWDHHDLVLTLQRAAERYHLSRENERLVCELDRRLRALEILQSVTAAAVTGAVQHPAAALLERLSEVLPFDLAAVLVASAREEPATLQIFGTRPVTHANIVELRDRALAVYEYAAAAHVDEERLRPQLAVEVAVDEVPRTVESQLQVPLSLAGRVVGTMVLQSFESGAYDENAGHLLHVLANGTAEVLEQLRGASTRQWHRLEQAIAALPDGVLLVDAAGHIELANANAQRLLGGGATTGANLWEVLNLDTALGPPDGRWVSVGSRVVRVGVTLAPAKAGEEGRAVVVLRDLTNERQAEERRRRFISTVSHEIRTPLSSVVASIDLLLHGFAGELGEPQRDYLGAAADACQALGRIVDELLDIEKFAAGAVDLHKTSVALGSLAQDVSLRYRAAADERGLSLVVESPTEDVAIVADAVRMEQVLSNLIVNAIRFAPVGSVVRISSHTAPGWGIFGVHNSGEPVPPAELGTIFDRFSVAPGTTDVGRRGSGLGLAICRTIVEAHGGVMLAESDSRGTSFWAALPYDDRRPSPERLVSSAPIWLDLPSQMVSEERLAAAAILLSRGLPVRLSPPDQDEAVAARKAAGAAFVISCSGRMLMDDTGCPWLVVDLHGDPDLTALADALATLARHRDRVIVVQEHMPAGVEGVLAALGVKLRQGRADGIPCPSGTMAEMLLALAEATVGDLSSLRRVKAMLRRAKSRRGLDTVCLFTMAGGDAFEAVYGSDRAGLLRRAFLDELRRATVRHALSAPVLELPRGALCTGTKGALASLKSEMERTFHALVRLHCRREDREQGYLVLGRERVPLVALRGHLLPLTVEEARLSALLTEAA